MFEDENEQSNYKKEKSYNVNRESLASNSAIKAAFFVIGLMLCVGIIYILIGTDSNGNPSATGTIDPSITPSSETNDPNSTSDTIESPPSETTPEPTPPETTPVDSFSFSKGDESPKVAELQELLKAKKYLSAGVQTVNTFGDNTEAAVKLFQADYYLEQSGIVDNVLFDKIQSAPERRVLKRNDTNEHVKELQELLKSKNYLNLGENPTTEFFGPQTETAVKLFQQTNGLPETGEVTNGLMDKIRDAAPYTPPA